MATRQYLMIPGPTPVPEDILRECSRPMINHRGPEFAKMQAGIDEGLQRIFQTSQDVLTLTTSGSGGMEAAIVNTLSPGDKVLALSIGSFGDRFAKIAKIYGANVEKMDFEWGTAVDPDRVKARLAEDKDREIKVVLVTHNETSTGVTNDVQKIAAVVREHGALVVVDAVSGLVAVDLQHDAWGIDVTVAASQKAFMIPPGLAFVALSERAWKAAEASTMPRFYFDLLAAREFATKGQTPFTPAVPLYYGLATSLKLIEAEGLQKCFARHRRLGEACRAGATALGLKLLADPAYASPAVTAIYCPEGITPKDLRKRMLDEWNIVLAGGQGKLQDTIFRIGHLGYVLDADLLGVMAALGNTLVEMGMKVDPGAGVDAALAAFAKGTA